MVNPDKQWEKFWLDTDEKSASDYEYDHGSAPRKQLIEESSDQELLSFADPQSSEIIFDAGCGSGAHTLLLHSKVRRVVAMDYNAGAVERCQKRLSEKGVQNAKVLQGAITSVPLADGSVDKIICMSVLQYLTDDDVLIAFNEFRRILKKGGTVILHVKNLSSVYLSTLWIVKKIKLLLGRETKLAYYRPFGWYLKALHTAGFDVVDYNSFNWFVIDGMPRALLSAIQKFEFEHYKKPFFNSGFVRRHGADVKIKARVVDGKNRD